MASQDAGRDHTSDMEEGPQWRTTRYARVRPQNPTAMNTIPVQNSMILCAGVGVFVLSSQQLSESKSSSEWVDATRLQALFVLELILMGSLSSLEQTISLYSRRERAATATAVELEDFSSHREYTRCPYPIICAYNHPLESSHYISFSIGYRMKT